MYDVAVIGGGPGGYVAAIKAAQMGRKTCIIEKDAFGGVCLNRGCIPTKSFLKSAEVMSTIKESAEFGIELETSGAVLNMERVQKRKNMVVQQLVKGVQGLLKANGVDVYAGEASFANKNTIMVGNQKIEAQDIIIATGSKVKSLPIPITDSEVLTSTELLNLHKLPESMTIIGGGVIGIEFAYFLAMSGVKVTVIEFLDQILPMVDEEITKAVAVKLDKLGIVIHTGAKVTSITENKVTYEKSGTIHVTGSEKILMAVGRTPDTEGLNLQAVGVKTERGAVITDLNMRTNVEGIYAIGDVNGKAMLAHVASMEGIIAVENICGHSNKMRYEQVPSAIYIQPEIACVGLTEAQARQRYGEIQVGHFPLIANGKSKIEGTTEGLIKIITALPYNEIVGVHIFSLHATDMISEAVLAMNLECTAEEIVNSIHPHPTISEAVHEACHAVYGKAIHYF
ncbi:MAG: dihydrolipoyl dehydrogenase [Clostridia bacterium]|nr:dihydrolipoyl dehydrogenase [Clostridia bacterium]